MSQEIEEHEPATSTLVPFQADEQGREDLPEGAVQEHLVEQEGESGEQQAESTMFQQLDSRGILLWKLEGLLGLGWIFVAALVGGTLLWSLAGVPASAILPAWGVLTWLLWFSIWWFPVRKHAAWSYRLDEQVLELCFGIFWQNSVMIPLSRLQHIDVNRSPLERRYALATLTIHTAGTKHAKHEIPHLESETALRLRQRLIEAAGIPVE